MSTPSTPPTTWYNMGMLSLVVLCGMCLCAMCTCLRKEYILDIVVALGPQLVSAALLVVAVAVTLTVASLTVYWCDCLVVEEDEEAKLGEYNNRPIEIPHDPLDTVPKIFPRIRKKRLKVEKTGGLSDMGYSL